MLFASASIFFSVFLGLFVKISVACNYFCQKCRLHETKSAGWLHTTIEPDILSDASEIYSKITRMQLKFLE